MDFKGMKGIRYIVFILGWFFASTCYAQSYTFIGNETGFKTAKLKYVKEVFKGKYSLWNNKETVVVVIPSTKSSSAEGVAKYLYGTSVLGMQKYWLALVFQGRSNPPVFLNSDEEIIEYVAKNPGAIGIVNTTTKNIPSGLKITITE